ncbi:ATP-binding protein [Xanthovirga aplysinae]|uniref:ATP-binding protein n=1 Tax=Xanthovirga aplysinae TaxID=2529853 RepID=UPI0012BD08F0|nr:transporter substrate-binding domain-containing protein [Xanthovirga aplysinae]MTI33242.1 transporter substrate-binding domain-containing protein [Xanthovirga aplysinae]
MKSLLFLIISYTFPLISVSQSQDVQSSLSNSPRLDQRHLIYGGIHNNAPLSYYDEKGQPAGFMIDLLNALSKELKFTIEYKLQSWPKTFLEFKNEGAFDLAEMYYYPGREKYADFSNRLLYIYFRVVVRGGAPPIFNLENLLNEKEVFILGESAIGEYMQNTFPSAKLFYTDTEAEALDALVHGKHDVAVVREFAAQRIDTEPQFSNLRTTGPPLCCIPFALVTHPQDSLLMTEISQGIEILRAKGIYSKIYSKWFSIYVPRDVKEKIKQLRRQRWTIGGILFTLLLATFWIYSLRRIVLQRTRALQMELSIRQKTMQKIGKINQELDKFVYSISHDINAPIASVTGLINLMKHESTDKHLDEYFHKIDKSLNSLKSYIHDILDYSRNSRIKLQFDLVNFPELLNECIDLLQFLPGTDRISIEKEIRESAPFYSDKYRLKVILNNLISNAIKYGDLNKEKPFINIKIDSNEKTCTIKVKDNGIGIPKDRQQKIFDMFYRASEKSEGAGIGLYIVKEVLVKLKGSILVESVEKEGSLFTVKIPNQKSGLKEYEGKDETQGI